MGPMEAFYETWWQIVGAVVVGAAIGLEREYRGRPAGLRTHTLVALASALLMIASMRQAEWSFLLMPGQTIVADPTRMAHGILTGIGFLCAGVIFREGFSVHGLTTAASLWLAAALGVLWGAGLIALAVSGTVATLLVLAGFRVADRWLPKIAAADLRLTVPATVVLEEAGFRELLSELGLRARIVRVRRREGGRIQVSATAKGAGPFPTDRLARALSERFPDGEFDISPRED